MSRSGFTITSTLLRESGMFHSSRVLLILATLIAAAMVVRSETLAIAVLPTGKATPDVEALADLSTAKLSATPGYRALERRQLSEALQERRITATLAGAAQIQDRRQLGTLLHAEALLFLERVESDGAAAYRATLSFTDTGLRAGARWFSAEDADLEAIADDLVAIVGEQAARRRTIRRVVAVSPLVCDNLAFCHSHLGRSFQTVIEQAVPRDVLVVELDEARAFAKEQLLAPPEQPVFQHAMPILIGGSYRNVEDNVAFSLRFSQGEQAFPARKLLASQSEMAARLHEDVAGFLRSLDGSADSVPDYGPHAEAGALWRQAETLVKAGQWADAANLLETALLIAPPDATCDAATWGTTPREGDEGAPARLNCRALLRSRVIQTYAVMIYVGQRKENLREPHDAVRLLDWTDRSLDHLEAFVADGLPGGGPIANDPRFHLSPAMSQLFFLRDQLASRFGDDLKSRIASLEVRMRKCYLRCVEKQVREHGWIHLNPSPHVFFPPGSFAKVSEGDEASQEYLRDCIEYVRIAYAQDDGNRIIRDMLDSFEVGVSPKLMAPYMEQLRSVLTGEMGGLLYRYGELNLRLAHLRASTVFTSPEWASMSRTMRIEAQIEDAKRRILGMQEIAKEAAELQRLARRRWPDDQRLRDDLRSLVSECQTSIQHTQRHRGELQAVLDSNGVPRAVSSPKADIPDAAETLLQPMLFPFLTQLARDRNLRPLFFSFANGIDLISCGNRVYRCGGEPDAGDLFYEYPLERGQAPRYFPVVPILFDGEHYWLSVGRRTDYLAVVDKNGKLLRTFTEKDGLLPTYYGQLAPIRPGQLAYAGFLETNGAHQSWLAIIDLRDGIRMIHAAKGQTGDPASDLEVATVPSSLSVHHAGKASACIHVGRGRWNTMIAYEPRSGPTSPWRIDMRDQPDDRYPPKGNRFDLPDGWTEKSLIAAAQEAAGWYVGKEDPQYHFRIVHVRGDQAYFLIRTLDGLTRMGAYELDKNRVLIAHRPLPREITLDSLSAFETNAFGLVFTARSSTNLFLGFYAFRPPLDVDAYMTAFDRSATNPYSALRFAGSGRSPEETESIIAHLLTADDPNVRERCLKLIADAYTRADRVEEFESAYEAFIRRDPKLLAHLFHSCDWRHRPWLDRLLARFRDCLLADPVVHQNSIGWSIAGLVERRRVDEAHVLAEALLDAGADRGLIPIQIAIGKCLADVGDYRCAEILAAKLSDLPDLRAEECASFGRAMLSMKQPVAAEAFFVRALAFKEAGADDILALEDTLRLGIWLGQANRVADILPQLLKRFPGNKDVAALAAAVAFETGDDQKAWAMLHDLQPPPQDKDADSAAHLAAMAEALYAYPAIAVRVINRQCALLKTDKERVRLMQPQALWLSKRSGVHLDLVADFCLPRLDAAYRDAFKQAVSQRRRITGANAGEFRSWLYKESSRQ